MTTPAAEGTGTPPGARTARAMFEIGLRLFALAALAVLLWRLLPRGDDAGASGAPVALRLSDDATTDSTGVALARMLLPFAAQGTTAPLQLIVHSLPGSHGRGALEAFAASTPGSTRALSWSDSSGARGLALDVAPGADPDGRVTVTASGARGRTLVLRDAGGVLDSGALAGVVTSVLVRRSDASAEALVGTSQARARMPAARPARRILAYGRPGWEAKFTIAALEESGWTVDASLPVAPRASVTVGAPATPDTARYAAVVVLDSGLARASVLARYASNGGGVVLSGDALRDRALAALVPARIGATRAEIPGGLLSPNPRSGLEAVRFTPADEAIVVQRDFDGTPAAIATRVGAGRVVASGYREVWRWRMEGPADGVEAHRAWWATLVRAAAFLPVGRDARQGGADGELLDGNAAPYADLVRRLGAPVPSIAQSRAAVDSRGGRTLDTLLLLAALVALVAEWASRRLRGAR